MTTPLEPQALIAGEWTTETGGGRLDSINPADGNLIASIPACDSRVWRQGKSPAAFDQWDQTKSGWIQTH